MYRLKMNCILPIAWHANKRNKLYGSIILLYLLTLMNSQSANTQEDISIVVDTQNVLRTMAGGIGASWHAIQKDLPAYSQDDYEYPIRKTAPRGSAVGGNPPLGNQKAWEQLYRYADWLGMDWMRVEMSQRMYEPERERFDWDNEEMQTLYRILDYCQSRDVDVFLTQMWGEVEWNAFPNVHPLQSAPMSVEDFVEGLGRLMDHLVHKKKYTCIRWLCISNEPGYDWAWWIGPNGHKHSITPALKAVRERLDLYKINVPLSGPDWTNPPKTDSAELPQAMDFDPYLGAYDIHSYDGPSVEQQQIWSVWAEFAHRRNKPCFLSEMGNMKLGWGGTNPGPKSFAAVLSNAETVIRGVYAGLDAFNRWSYVNRGDLDGQWQLVRTWDIENQAYYDEVIPEPVAYYGYGMLTRFTAKHSDVLDCRVNGYSNDGILAAAVRSPQKQITVLLLNRSDRTQNTTVDLKGIQEAISFTQYRITEVEADRSDFQLKARQTIRVSPSQTFLKVDVPANSMTVYTTYVLKEKEAGVITE